MPVSFTPNLMVRDIRASIGFYGDLLGFSLVMVVPEGANEVLTTLPPTGKMRYAMLSLANSSLMIQERASLIEDVPALADTVIGRGTSVTFYYQLERLDALLQTLPAGIEIIRPERTSWYGMREVYLRDPDGYILALAQEKDGP